MFPHFVFVCVFGSILLGFVDPKNAKTGAKAREVPDGDSENEVTVKPEVIEVAQGEDVQQDCAAYSYCRGTRFPATVSVLGKMVTCNQVPHPVDMCCLTSEPHLVCYNIQVDGLFLSFDQNEPSYTTDFTGFCELMLQEVGSTMGKYTSITKDLDAGQLAFRYNEWHAVPSGTDGYHIRDLSCGVDEPVEES